MKQIKYIFTISICMILSACSNTSSSSRNNAYVTGEPEIYGSIQYDYSVGNKNTSNMRSKDSYIGIKNARP